MQGSRAIGLGIGLVTLFMLFFLPFLIPVAFYVFASVYGIVTGTDFGSDTVNVGVLLTGLVITVAFFLVVLAGTVALAGRVLSPRSGG